MLYQLHTRTHLTIDLLRLNGYRLSLLLQARRTTKPPGPSGDAQKRKPRVGCLRRLQTEEGPRKFAFPIRIYGCFGTDTAKCDGVGPVCGACLHRSSTCTFQSLPGLTRTAALKSEVAQLRTNSSNLLELYRQLRDGSAVEAWNLVEKIRSGEVLIDVPPSADVGQGSIGRAQPRPSGLVEALDPAISQRVSRMSQPAIASSQGTSSLYHIKKRCASSQRNHAKSNGREIMTQAQCPAINRRVDEPLPCQTLGQAEISPPFHGEQDSHVPLQLSLRENLDKIQEGFHMQQSCISEIFFCHSKETFGSLMSCLEQEYADPPASSTLCEICAVATIAGQYVQEYLRPGLLD